MFYMRKRVYYGIALSALICGVGMAVAAADSGTIPSVPGILSRSDGDTQEVITSGSPSVSGECVIDGREVYLRLSVTAPTEGRNDDWIYSDLAGIDSLLLYRDADSWYDDPTLLATWTNVEPGATLTYEDKDEDLVKGKEYTYEAVAFVGSKRGNTGYAYATLGIKPITPNRPTLEPTGTGVPVTVKYTCPEALSQKNYYSDPEPLPDGVTYEKLILSRRASGVEVMLETQENPVPGTEYTYIDNDAPDGNNTYYLKTVTFVGESDQASASIFLGLDYPSAPSRLSATEADGKVTVTWEAPSAGYNGGVLDQSKVRYAVYRKSGSYDTNPKLLADDVVECSYTDDLADITAEQMVYYRVRAYNDVEAPANAYNYAETYNGIMVGPPAPLPFRETFNAGNKFNKSFDKMWETDFSWESFSNYYIRNTDQTINVGGDAELHIAAGVDGGSNDDEAGADGFFYVTPAVYYYNCGEGYLTSGNLSFATATNPYVSFWYVPVNNSTGTVAVEVNKDGENKWREVSVVSYDDPELDEQAVSTSLEWKKVYIPMPDYSGVEKAKVRLRFKYTDSRNFRYAMLLDEVNIDDYPAVTGLTVERSDVAVLDLSWSLPESAGDKKVAYNIYLGDEKIATVGDNKYSYTGAEQGEIYSFSVEAVYDDGDVTAPKSAPAVYDYALTSFTIDGCTYNVYDDNVSLAAYIGESESVTIPASVEYKNRKFDVVELLVSVFKGNRTVKEVNIDAQINEIPVEFLYGCVSLTSVRIPETVVNVDDKAFFGCAKLESIELPSSVSRIGDSSFEHSGLKSMNFPQSLTEIGSAAFRYCSDLSEVRFAADVPPTVGAGAFAEISDPCLGYCPDASLEAYKAVEEMSPITFYTTGLEDIIGDGGDVVSTEIYTLSGVRVVEPASGQVVIVRIRYADGSVRTEKTVVR